MRIATLDIETTPSEAGLARMVAKKLAKLAPPSNYRDPEKIEAWMAEKRASLEADCQKAAALSPLYGQVVSAAIWDSQTGGHVRTLGQAEGDEAELLAWVEDALATGECIGAGGPVDLAATFNGASFDVPYLRTRMLIHGLTPPVCLEQRRYHHHPHCDLRMLLVDWDQYASGDLSEWCAALGVPCPGKDLGITGADVAPMAAAGRWEEIGRYNLGDAVATWGLLERCWPLVRSEIPGAQGRTLAEVIAPPGASSTTASTTTAEMEVW